jgi:nicotinamide-nucleotide adenylyltransferase
MTRIKFSISVIEREALNLALKRGLFVGRFQPFHNGHIQVIEDVLKENGEIIIVIGSAQYSHRVDNPFTAGERATMVRRALDEAKIPAAKTWIIPVADVHVHMLWVAKVVGYTPKFSVVYSNEPLTRRLFMEAGYKVKSIPFHKRSIYSSTEIRQRMLTNKDWKTLVPKSVATYIQEIDGVERLRDLSKTDELKK